MIENEILWISFRTHLQLLNERLLDSAQPSQNWRHQRCIYDDQSYFGSHGFESDAERHIVATALATVRNSAENRIEWIV